MGGLIRKGHMQPRAKGSGERERSHVQVSGIMQGDKRLSMK